MKLAEAGKGKEKYFVNISHDAILEELRVCYVVSADYLHWLLDQFWDTCEIIMPTGGKSSGCSSPN